MTIFRAAAPWEIDDAFTLSLLFLGPVAVCAVASVARVWRAQVADPALWAQLLPRHNQGKSQGLLGPHSLSETVRALQDGRHLAAVEIGGHLASVAVLDLYGDLLALGEAPPTAAPSQRVALEVHRLGLDSSESTKCIFRYEAAIRSLTALRLVLDTDGAPFLAAADSGEHVLLLYNLLCPERDVGTFPRVERNGAPRSVAPFSWLARAGCGHLIGATHLGGPSAIVLMSAEDGHLSILSEVRLDLDPLAELLPSTAVWYPDSNVRTLRVATALTLTWGDHSLQRTIDGLLGLQSNNGENAIASMRTSDYFGITSPPYSPEVPGAPDPEEWSPSLAPAEQPHFGMNDGGADIHPALEETAASAPVEEVAANTGAGRGEGPVSFETSTDSASETSWAASSVEAVEDVFFEPAVAVSFDFCLRTSNARAQWVGQPFEYCRDVPLRYCHGGPSSAAAVFAVISYSAGAHVGAGSHNAVAIAEHDPQTGHTYRTFQLPQVSLTPLICWQWLGPLLLVAEPSGSAGTLHLFTFEHALTWGDVSVYEGFHLVTSRVEGLTGLSLSRGSSLSVGGSTPAWETGSSRSAVPPPPPPRTSTPAPPSHSPPPLALVDIENTSENELNPAHDRDQLQTSASESHGRTPIVLSGLWRVLHRHDGQSYRYHLRVTQTGSRIQGSGICTAIQGKVIKDGSGGVSVQFRQKRNGDGHTSECEAVMPAGMTGHLLRGSWADSDGNRGSFTAAQEAEGLRGARRPPALQVGMCGLAQGWGTSGHRFALLLEGHTGAVICAWAQPFAFSC